MAETTHFVIDGDATLQQQENTLNTSQNLRFSEVTVYSKGEQNPPGNGSATTVPDHPNFVTLEEVGIGEPVRELFLVIPTDLAAEKIRQAGQGRSLVFFNDVFVGGVLQQVAGFH
ncbi:MAG: hypothetical protein JNK38_22835 [Acidobacteria bacterium]|nr:hypothetical protein [Acidobacteriota bacterium]